MATTVTASPATHAQTQFVQVPTAVPPPTDHPAKKFKNVFMTVGISLVITGVLSFILGGVSLSPALANGAGVASGMWGGAWYVVSGGLAISSAVRPNSCNVIAGLVVSILTSLVAFGVGISEAVLSSLCNVYYNFQSYSFNHCVEGFKGIHGTIACLSFLACVLAIIHSSYCCCGTCCQSNYQGGIVTTTTYTTVPVQQPYGQAYQQQTYIPPGQPHQAPVYVQPQPGQAFGAPAGTSYAPSPQQYVGGPQQPQPAYAPPPYTDQKQAFQ